jgi:endonuclease/exonuclease/phosphatase family metal-dependent hydrolase
VLHWNTHHGYELEQIATWIAKMNPDLVSLNEVEKHSHDGSGNQPARYAALLEAKTGKTWYYHFAQRYGDWSSRGQGNVILSRFPIDATASMALACGRSAAVATLDVNGRTVTVLSTHLDNELKSCRMSEISEIRAAIAGFGGYRILAGDWNATPRSEEYKSMLSGYNDAWAEARVSRDAVDIPGNSESGATYQTRRIDYIFSAEMRGISVEKAQVFDTAVDGDAPSDHKPLLVTFTIE